MSRKTHRGSPQRSQCEIGAILIRAGKAFQECQRTEEELAHVMDTLELCQDEIEGLLLSGSYAEASREENQ